VVLLLKYISKGDIFEGKMIQRYIFPLYNRDGLDNNNTNPMLRKKAIEA